MRKIVPECRALDSTPIEEIAIEPENARRHECSAQGSAVRLLQGGNPVPPCSRFWRRTFSRVHAEMSGDRAWIYGASSCLR